MLPDHVTQFLSTASYVGVGGTAHKLVHYIARNEQGQEVLIYIGKIFIWR